MVTGAARGIGLEAARQLAGEGFRTYLTAGDTDRADAAAAGPVGDGLDVVAGTLDVGGAGSVERFAAWLASEVDPLDVLVSNAAAVGDWSDAVSAAALAAAPG